jgi:hypothetical protein
MNRIANMLLLLILAVIAGGGLFAQQKADSKQTQHGALKIYEPNVYLGKSEFRDGPIQKNAFINLMKQGLTAHGTHGDLYTVVGFDFSYAEQKLYEDSTGNIVMMIDLSSEYCRGDTLSSDIAYARNMLKSVYLTDSSDIPKGLYDRVKPGDTLYFDHIRLADAKKNQLSDTATIAGKGMKFYIVK